MATQRKTAGTLSLPDEGPRPGKDEAGQAGPGERRSNKPYARQQTADARRGGVDSAASTGERPRPAAGGSPASKSGGRYADKGAGRYADKGAGRYADKGAGRYADKGAGRYADKGAGRYADKGAGRYADKGAGRYAGKGEGFQKRPASTPDKGGVRERKSGFGDPGPGLRRFTGSRDGAPGEFRKREGVPEQAAGYRKREGAPGPASGYRKREGFERKAADSGRPARPYEGKDTGFRKGPTGAAGDRGYGSRKGPVAGAVPVIALPAEPQAAEEWVPAEEGPVAAPQARVTTPSPSQADRALRQALIDTACRMNALRINHGRAGNVSARAGDGFLITPSGLAYEAMVPADIVRMDRHGNPEGRRAPSSEWRFHRDIYAARADCGAVVHTHAPHATALACLRSGLPAFHYMVAIAGGHDIRCAAYATFGTQQLSDNALVALEGRTACLLANHGLIAIGADLAAALALAEEVEALSAMYWRARQVGDPVLLPAEEMTRVLERLRSYGQPETAAADA